MQVVFPFCPQVGRAPLARSRPPGRLGRAEKEADPGARRGRGRPPHLCSGAFMRSWVEISLGTIRANFRAVRVLADNAAEIMPVGRRRCVQAWCGGSFPSTGRRRSFPARAVANAQKRASRLRQAGIRARILVMADFLAG